jgi:plastocyanin
MKQLLSLYNPMYNPITRAMDTVFWVSDENDPDMSVTLEEDGDYTYYTYQHKHINFSMRIDTDNIAGYTSVYREE